MSERTPTAEFYDRTGEPWPADPTPKPTAEEDFHTSCSCPICMGIRSKAFEEAAEAAQQSEDPDAPGPWNAACEYIEAAIFALAKEQADGR